MRKVSGGTYGESVKGDKRTGPALNPLKGSSARVPRSPTGANLTPFLTLLVSTHCHSKPRKNVVPPAKIYASH